MRTDYIDLYFAPIDDAETPLDETLEAFDRLARSGKVRGIGASNYGPERLAEALSTSEKNRLISYTVLRPDYNLVDAVASATTVAQSEELLGATSLGRFRPRGKRANRPRRTRSRR